MPFLFKYWKYIAVVILLASLYGAHKYALYKEYHRGFDDAMMQVNEAAQEADKETIKKQTVEKKKTKEKVHATRKEQGADAPASPYLRGILDRLQDD